MDRAEGMSRMAEVSVRSNELRGAREAPLTVRAATRSLDSCSTSLRPARLSVAPRCTRKRSFGSIGHRMRAERPS